MDRVSRRNLLMMTQTGAMLLAFALAALTFTGVVKEWHVIVLAALLGVVNAFDAPARQAFVPEMVGKKDLPNAIALNFDDVQQCARHWPGDGRAFAGDQSAQPGVLPLMGFPFWRSFIGLWLMKLPPHRSVATYRLALAAIGQRREICGTQP